jgi:hypothetical protein
VSLTASHRARLDRAHDHIEVVTRELREWLDMHAPFPTDELDPVTGANVVRAKLAEDIPPAWGPLIGDALHNLRSSLDHLVYALTVANTPAPLPTTLERSCEFPIFSTQELFERSALRAISGITDKAKETIAALQPYQRGEDFGLDPLWLLRELSNIDKHRRPALTSLYVEPTMNVRSGSVEAFEVSPPGSIKPGTDFVLGTYRRADQTADVGFGFVYDIAFNEPLAWQPAWTIQILYTIWAHIDNTIFPSLEPFLSARS